MYMCVCVYICIYKQVCVSNIVFPCACVFHTETAVLESQNKTIRNKTRHLLSVQPEMVTLLNLLGVVSTHLIFFPVPY